MDLSPHHLRVDGRSLATLANGITDFDGHVTAPAVRGGDISEVWRPGLLPGGYNLVPEATIQRLKIWAAPWDADGDLDPDYGPEGHRRENVNELLKIFGKRGSGISVAWDVPDLAASVVTLTNTARVRESVPVTGNHLRGIDVALEYPYPYWHVGDAIVRAGASSHSFTPGGYSEIWDMVLTFAGDGTLTHTQSGDTITVVGSAGPVTVNVGARTITEGGSPARNRARFNRPWWQRWNAGQAVTLTVSGTTVAVTYYEAALA
jgi:hypothetical protein